MNKLMKRTLSILTVIAMTLACLPVLSFADDIPSIGIGGGLNGTLSPDRNVEIMVSSDKGGQVQFRLTLSDGEATPWVGGVSLNGPGESGAYTFNRHFDAGESLILSMSADRETGYSLATKMTREDVVLEEEPAQAEAAEEPAEEPAQAEPAEEPAEEPAQAEPAEEPAAEPEQTETAEEPAEEPEQAEAVEEPAEEPEQAEAVEEPAEEPAQAEVVEEPAEEPAQDESVEESADEEPEQAEAEEEPAEEPEQAEAEEEPAAEPEQVEPAEEPAAEQEQEEAVEEPAEEPEQAEAAEEPAEEPAQAEATEEPVEEPAQAEAAEEPVEEPAQAEEAEELAEEPAQAEATEEPAAEPAQAEPAEEPAEEPAQAEAAEEPVEEPAQADAADPEPEEEIPEFEINSDVLKKYNGEDETVIVPDGIRVIGIKAFAGNKKITKVILPDSVEVIKNYAFDDCSNLENIVKGPESSLRTIGIGAFQNAAKLDTSFADDVMNIVSNAFEMAESGAEEAAGETTPEKAEPAAEPEQAEAAAEPVEESAKTVSPDDCSVRISISWDTDDPQIGDIAHFDSVLTGYESLPYTLQWQTSRDNETWTDYPGANGPQLDVVLTEDLDGVLFRLSVNVESKQEEE